MLAYLFSRYPVISQTFCDSEMLALEAMGVPLVIGSLNPPPDSFRHERLDRLAAEVVYPPPPGVLRGIHRLDPEGWERLQPLIERHGSRYPDSFKPETRARNALYFARRFGERGVRHVHVHFANRATHTALFLRELGFRFSFTAHARDFMIDLGSDDLLREMAERSEFVVAVSDFSADLLRARCPSAAERVVRIYNGIDPEAFPTASPGARGPDEPLRILSVGRLVAFKGFLDLLEACRLLRDRGVDFELEIVGDGPLRGTLERFLKDHDLASRVHLLGSRSQDEIKARLAASHAFALACTTDPEGGTDILPTVIMEAMAAGLPVVSTAIAGVPEMVENRVTGLLGKPGDPESIADAISVLAESPPEAATLGDAGRRLCRERFALSVTAPALRAVFATAGAIPSADAVGASESASAEDGESGRSSQKHPDNATVAVLLDIWPPRDPVLAGEIRVAADVRGVMIVAAGLAADPPEPLPDGTLDVAFLPDAVVVESIWRRLSDDVLAGVDRLRAELGGAMGGEEFYLHARRAAWLATLLRQRGIRLVHAARSDSFLSVLILHRLWGFAASLTVERRPVVPRSTLAAGVRGFAALSVADARLAERLPGAPSDRLMVEPPAKPAIHLGPLRIPGRPGTEPVEALRRRAAEDWYRELTRLAEGQPFPHEPR